MLSLKVFAATLSGVVSVYKLEIIEDYSKLYNDYCNQG